MSKSSALSPSSGSSAKHSLAAATPIYTPTSTPTSTPQPSASTPHVEIDESLSTRRDMDSSTSDKPSDEVEAKSPQQVTPPSTEATIQESTPSSSKQKKKCVKHSQLRKSKKSKKAEKAAATSSESDLDSSDDDSSDSDSEDSTSVSSPEDEKEKKKKARKRKALKKKKKKQRAKNRRAKYQDSDSDTDSDEADLSSSESDSSENEKRRKKNKKSKKSRKAKEESEEEATVEEDSDEVAAANEKLVQAQLAAMQVGRNRRVPGSRGLNLAALQDQLGGMLKSKSKKNKKNKKSEKNKKLGKRASTLEYKRIDQLWDSTIHNYKLTESAEDQDDEFDQYIFTVRRKFDWENKYKNTVVDIKSKLLRDALAEVMKDVKGVSLVEDRPSIDPNMLFLYLEELRTHAKKTLKARAKAEKKRKAKKKIVSTISECKLLVSYLDEDYEETKKTLYPMLEAGNITFDLIWALFKPNSIAYTTTYGSAEDPRCFKVDYATRESSFMRGEWYSVEGRYLEYDGKSFGLGDFEVQVDAFKGARKITGLATYPMKYHKDPEGLKTQLVERGKRFVAMEGMNYRFHKGLAFMKKKKTVAKVNINGRVMIDPAIFRRINPNYPISMIKPKDPDGLFGDEDEDEDASSCCGCDDSDDEQPDGAEGPANFGEDKDRERTRYKVVFDRDDQPHVVEVAVDENGREIISQTIENLDNNAEPSTSTDSEDTNRKSIRRDFSEEELLIASPVVLGFAFSEKLWLEFSLSGICDIDWNDGAFESLVLPASQKSIVKALVESHKFHAAKTIDDVVQGKGKGLVAVLHGPPGTGKTLTAEGIAELLKCPLYMVSAGELGTDPRVLEHELQKILDIAHSWGAVLLLDEADVFLEKREVHDIHRNALVSIFLRLLEYFQGILFLTTNRVETFDDAFQSRIHVALRYGELTAKAKKAVWKMFLEKVRDMEGIETYGFKDSDYDLLARNNMNGRQIKNAVRTAQALAVNQKQSLNMEHIKRVLEVAQSFENDLKGGTGYMDAMRSYT